jgi:hypothetical protein
MNVDLSGERLVEMESNVMSNNEQVMIAESLRKLPVTLDCFASDRLACVLVGIGLLLGILGCDRVVTADGIREQAILGTDLRVQVVDLGLVVAGGRTERVVEIYNPHPRKIEITDVRVGCECVSIILESMSFPPRGAIQTQVVADLSDEPNFRGGLGVQVAMCELDGTEVVKCRIDVSVVCPE